MHLRRSANEPFDEEYWTSKPLNLHLAQAQAGTHDLYAIDLHRNHPGDDTFARATAALFRYRVFPPRRMKAHVCTRDGRIVTGATIIQRVLIGPLVMEMAVRVVAVFDDAKSVRRAGFTYATLAGHSERGTATFLVREQPDKSIAFEIESWSRPGDWLARLGRPLARLAQRTFTREALAHFRDLVQVH